MEKYKVTVQELIDHLKVFKPDAEIIFGDDQLTFNRTKRRGENLVQIEFNEEFDVTDDT